MATAQLTDAQADSIRTLERHVQDYVRELVLLRKGDKPSKDALTNFLHGAEQLLNECLKAKSPGDSSFEVTEYEDYTTIKFSLTEFGQALKQWKGKDNAGGKPKKEKLSADQQDALETLKNYIEGRVDTILKIDQGEQPRESQVQLLIEQAETAFSNCAALKVPDSSTIQVTNYSDPSQSKVTFTISELKDRLPKWKNAHGSVVGKREKKAADDKSESDARAKKEADYDALSDDQKELIKTLNLNFDQMSEKIKNMHEGDHYSLLDGPAYTEYLTQLQSDIKKSKLPDDYILEDAKVTIGQVRNALPDWISLAKFGEEIAALNSAYPLVVTNLRDVEAGDDSARENRLGAAEVLEEAIKNARKKKVPDSMTVKGNHFQDIEDITFGELQTAFPSWKDVFAQGVAAKTARYEKAYKKYHEAMSGDKLRIFKESIVKFLVVNRDNSVAWMHGGFYDVDEKFISTPAEFAKAKIWANTGYGYTNTDVLKIDPHWYLDIYHFDGMKLVNTTRKRGPGKKPSVSEFTFQKK